MKKVYLSVMIILTLLLISGCYDTKKSEEIEGYKREIELVDKKIKEVHPNPFGYVSEEEWDYNISELKKNLNKMTKEDINLKLMDIVSDIKDGHTNYIFQLIPEEKVFPIGLKKFGEEFRIWGVDRVYEDILGLKILGINGIKMEDVIDKISELYGYDNYISKAEFGTMFLSRYSLLDYVGIAENELITLNLEDGNGNKIDKSINTIKVNELENTEVVFYDDKFKNKTIPISEQKPRDASDSYWYKLVEEDEILFVSFKKCDDDKFNEFKNGLLKTINDNKDKIKSIVFDLRNNGGGSTEYMASLIIGIKSIEDINNIKVYSFINGGTYSAGADAAIVLARDLDATTIGSDTGVIKHSYGDYSEVKLPNLNAQLTCSQKSFNYEEYVSEEVLSKLIHKTKDGKDTLGPEIYIEDNFGDYESGIDECYEYVAKNK